MRGIKKDCVEKKEGCPSWPWITKAHQQNFTVTLKLIYSSAT